ncbi:MAG: hypothetical protein KTR26_17690 [Flammeovirgaceae bacterium]|nr:hypothetical protein [Flammeovirgaceae bacterium]
MLFGLIYSFINTSWVITPTVLLLVVFIQLGELIHFLERSFRELNNFLLSIKHQDFSGTYSETGGRKNDHILQSAFNEINTAFKEIKHQH